MLFQYSVIIIIHESSLCVPSTSEVNIVISYYHEAVAKVIQLVGFEVKCVDSAH